MHNKQATHRNSEQDKETLKARIEVLEKANSNSERRNKELLSNLNKVKRQHEMAKKSNTNLEKRNQELKAANSTLNANKIQEQKELKEKLHLVEKSLIKAGQTAEELRDVARVGKFYAELVHSDVKSDPNFHTGNGFADQLQKDLESINKALK
ncbi:hypothetical protein P154DRAFT_519926 [Amniculicola lignicola CBS 123094]|uniref:Uncharacterized protein n=1 Tax=Amniculicola lignicola CBS 123094 TaxID=1392246 RepID=A0A6A5WX87_9PLEO|nr:hypothetical protein P154DRAFT_519926 [Amniculicola lignicola CBS 123094]